MSKVRSIRPSSLADLIPHPATNANKYTRGKLSFCGGDAPYPGAAHLACSAGMRMGAGYVEAYVDSENVDIMHVTNPQVVCRPRDDLDLKAPSLTGTSSGHPQGFLVGSGMEAHDSPAGQLVLGILKSACMPVVVDGGAITLLASEMGSHLAKDRHSRGIPTLATPHFGEAARLAGNIGLDAASEDLGDREANGEYAMRLASAYGAFVVLKGSDTYIASPDGCAYCMDFGGSELAKAGTGDVLAGILGALVAQGMDALDACKLATSVHAISGQVAKGRLGDVCVEASDVIDSIPQALSLIEQLGKDGDHDGRQ